MTPNPLSARTRLACWLVLLAALQSCGGGGGTAAAPPPTGQPQQPPAAGPLATHLSACPDGLVVDQRVPCMVGLYEGRTTDTGTSCAFSYGSDGVALYTAGGQSLRAVLSITTSGSVFEKKAAANDAGFSIGFNVGIASGQDMDLSYKDAAVPASATGLLVRPRNAAVPACLVTAGPTVPAAGGGSTANLLGRSWAAPQALNAGGAVGVLSGQLPFDAGLADDGRAVVVFRQPDGGGRMAVHVVDGRPGATWSAPQVLDAAAPLAAGNFRPRVAVSANGHAAATWMAELPCEADAYETDPAGKTCRYVYAARRLAGEAAWGAAQRVRASPPMAAPDHYVRINARGDVAIAFPSFVQAGSPLTATMVALRQAADTGWRVMRLRDFWSNSLTTQPFAQKLLAALGDDGQLTLAGNGVGAFSGLARARVDAATAPELLINATPNETGVHVYEMRSSGSFAAYTSKEQSGPYDAQRPERLSVYSPTGSQWLAAYDLAPYTLYGATALASTERAGGEFIVYSGCRLTAWRAGTWGATRALPAFCGRDTPGGLYAFNRDGDYLGIHWAGQAGQWGYYSYAQDRLLKGAPGSATAAAGDLLLGTASGLFDPASTLLLLAPGGLALAVTSNTFSTLPSAASPAGVDGGAGRRLWAVFLN